MYADVDDFYEQCDPDKENLCLYGNPDCTWEVQLPAEEVPPELPEPALGINFARDGMQVLKTGAMLWALLLPGGFVFTERNSSEFFKGWGFPGGMPPGGCATIWISSKHALSRERRGRTGSRSSPCTRTPG